MTSHWLCTHAWTSLARTHTHTRTQPYTPPPTSREVSHNPSGLLSQKALLLNLWWRRPRSPQPVMHALAHRVHGKCWCAHMNLPMHIIITVTRTHIMKHAWIRPHTFCIKHQHAHTDPDSFTHEWKDIGTNTNKLNDIIMFLSSLVQRVRFFFYMNVDSSLFPRSNVCVCHEISSGCIPDWSVLSTSSLRTHRAYFCDPYLSV